MFVCLVSYYSSISSWDESITFHILFHNVALKWHVIYTFCSLFLVIFPWSWLCPALCHLLSCYVSFVLFLFGTLFNCSLQLPFFFCCVCFSNYFRMASAGCIFLCLSNCSQRDCLAVICMDFTCLLLLVIIHPVFAVHIVLICCGGYGLPFPTIVPWVQNPPSSH